MRKVSPTTEDARDARSAHERPRAGGALGIVGKFTSPPLAPTVNYLHTEDGEAIPAAIQKDGSLRLIKTHEQARAERWALKAIASKVLWGSLTSKCMVYLKPTKGEKLGHVELWKGHVHGKAFYQGLMTCRSVWACPLCAAKISERRRVELDAGHTKAITEMGWRSHLVTLTIPHGIGDDLTQLLKLTSKALGRMSGGKNNLHAKLEKAFPGEKIHGFVRSLEVTHRVHGWHPHFHLIVFTSQGVTPEDLLSVYRPAWQKACVSVGLGRPSDEHGIDVKDGTYAASYASKWGIEDEMTKSHAKQGRLGSITPWGLLRAVLDEDNPDYPPERASALFKVYAKAFHHRKQLRWSPGLRELLELEQEVSDDVIAEAPDEEQASLYAKITVSQWRSIRRRQMQPHMLTSCEAAPQLVQSVIDRIANLPPPKIQPSAVSDGKREPRRVTCLVPADRRAPNYTFEDGYCGRRSTGMRLTARTSDTVSIFSNGYQMDDSQVAASTPTRAIKTLRPGSALQNVAEDNVDALGIVIRSRTGSASLRKPDGAPPVGCQPCEGEASSIEQLQLHVASGESGPVSPMTAIAQSVIAWVEYRNSYQKGGTHEETAHPVLASRKVRHGRNRADVDLYQDARGGQGVGGQLGLQHLVSYAALRE